MNKHTPGGKFIQLPSDGRSERKKIKRLQARVERLEDALRKIARRDVPDATAHGQAIVAREALTPASTGQKS